MLITLKANADPKTAVIDAPIELGGKPEYLAADGAGKVYVNLEDKDQIAVVDLKARKVLCALAGRSRWLTCRLGHRHSHAQRSSSDAAKPQKILISGTRTTARW